MIATLLAVTGHRRKHWVMLIISYTNNQRVGSNEEVTVC